MRIGHCFIASCAVIVLVQSAPVHADHDMTCHEPPPPPKSPKGGNVEFEWKVEEGESIGPGEGINLILPGAGGAMSNSCGDAGGGTFPVIVHHHTGSAIEHVPGTAQDSRWWFFEPVTPTFIDDRLGLSAQLPNFTKPDGTPLLTQHNETNLDFILSSARTFTKGETLAVSGGTSSVWPGATLYELPSTFDLDDLFDRPAGQFPAYTGTAVVAYIATIAVIPEPAVGLMLSVTIGCAGCIGRRRPG